MGKHLLRHWPKLFLTISLCSVAFSAHAEEVPQTQVETDGMEASASNSTLSYQVTPPPEMQYGTVAPQQEYRETKRAWPNRRLLGTSALVFTAAYAPTLISAAVNDDDSSDNLFIPIAGPWMEIARDEPSAGNKALLVFSGLFQNLGALGMVGSLFIPETRTERWYLMGNRRFQAAPFAARNTYGVSAHGTF